MGKFYCEIVFQKVKICWLAGPGIKCMSATSCQSMQFYKKPIETLTEIPLIPNDNHSFLSN